MTKHESVEVVGVEGTELYRRYAGQSGPQPVRVYLDCEHRKLSTAYNPEIGNAVEVVPGRQLPWFASERPEKRGLK